MTPLPYEIIEAMIQCFGRCFHYKDLMASFLVSAGLERVLVDKHRGEYKFTWARRLLTELGELDEGLLLQRRILTELCKLKDIPDPKVSDRDSAIEALRKLKHLAVEHDLLTIEQQTKGEQKVDQKFESTRGLYVSVVGFRDEVADHFSETGGNIVLMDGMELAFILEGRIDLREALRIKIENAARRGIAFSSVVSW